MSPADAAYPFVVVLLASIFALLLLTGFAIVKRLDILHQSIVSLRMEMALEKQKPAERG